ncbi:MAG: rod shape-determining protein RodA [Acidimicrobiales bacterium]
MSTVGVRGARWREIGGYRRVNGSRSPAPERRVESGPFRRKPPPVWRHADLLLILAAAGITALGVLMILSSTRGTDPDAYDLSFLRRQLVFVAMGVATMILVATVDYRRLRDWGWLPYVVVLAMLALVLTGLGTERRGTQAWFQVGEFQLQPAELAKVVVIIAVAALLAIPEPPLAARWVGGALVSLGLPMGLILLQPDMGTALVFVAISMGMLLIGGARLRQLVIVTAVGVIGVVGILNSDVLEDYQRDRLTGFLDPDTGLSDETYNANQSMIAIGSGGASGRGVFEGTQTRLGNVPEQHTDFIFTALGEELGFAGCATVLVLFWVVCWRVWRTAQIARDRFGMLLCGGVLSMLVFQVFQNVGMTMGIMPITGIPLPFMSYGGSSTIASWAALGLVLNVHMRRFR